jgi:hypothetical protein
VSRRFWPSVQPAGTTPEEAEIPDTDPQQFTGGLVDRAKSLFSEDAAAIKRIEKGTPGPTMNRVSSALGEKNRAKAVIETGNQKEKGGPL